ncbi:hypothetical protein ACIBKZ_15705 [Streptomyces sp. NPDC050421]|uniref:hypothetical protein n=1 Tax=Streptomyces sp. NPDC050421 TaxID=3365613 RepID=UPI0037B11F3D
MINTTRKTEARLKGSTGEALAWHTDKEAGKLSIATKGDRVVFSTAQAREFAAWLVKAADEIDANAGLEGLAKAMMSTGRPGAARFERVAESRATPGRSPWRY